MRRNTRVDNNQKEIVKVMKKLGYTVEDIKWPCDKLLGKRGLNFLIEIKNEDNSPSQKKLTPKQEKFHENWNGQIDIIESVDQFIAWDKRTWEKFVRLGSIID